MALADLFRPERITAALSNPATLIGLQLLAAGGPQAQQMSTGQRLAAAAQGFQQQSAQQQQLQQADVLSQLRQLQLRQSEREIKSAEQLQQRMADTAFLATLPEFSRKMAEAGATPAQLWQVFEGEQRLAHAREQGDALQAYRQQQLGIQQQRADAYVGRQHQLAAGGGGQPGAPAGPKAPNPRQFNVRSLGQGWFQQEVFDPATGQYRDHGAPFRQGVQADIGEDYGEPPVQDAGEQPAPWSSLPTGSPRVQGGVGQQPAAQPLPEGVTAQGGMAYRGDVPMPHVAVQQPAPIAAGGGGMAREQQARMPAGFPASPAQVAQPRTKAEYDALPPGTRYLDPATGKVATKR